MPRVGAQRPAAWTANRSARVEPEVGPGRGPLRPSFAQGSYGYARAACLRDPPRLTLCRRPQSASTLDPRLDAQPPDRRRPSVRPNAADHLADHVHGDLGSTGLRLDIWPFSIGSLQRPTNRGDRLPAFWADGLSCSVGCTAPGARPGWPIRPFHQQHAIRAGINELRPANFHVAVDIEARNFQPVYALQSGYARIRYRGTGDVNVDVGNFDYWHINPTVSDGQYVSRLQDSDRAGAVRLLSPRPVRGQHVRLSEPAAAGGSLRPYTDTEPPIIGRPASSATGG